MRRFRHFLRVVCAFTLLSWLGLAAAAPVVDEIVFRDSFESLPWPSAGSVGYRGDPASLTVIDANSITTGRVP